MIGCVGCVGFDISGFVIIFCLKFVELDNVCVFVDGSFDEFISVVVEVGMWCIMFEVVVVGLVKIFIDV